MIGGRSLQDLGFLAAYARDHKAFESMGLKHLEMVGILRSVQRVGLQLKLPRPFYAHFSASAATDTLKCIAYIQSTHSTGDFYWVSRQLRMSAQGLFLWPRDALRSSYSQKTVYHYDEFYDFAPEVLSEVRSLAGIGGMHVPPSRTFSRTLGGGLVGPAMQICRVLDSMMHFMARNVARFGGCGAFSGSPRLCASSLAPGWPDDGAWGPPRHAHRALLA